MRKPDKLHVNTVKCRTLNWSVSAGRRLSAGKNLRLFMEESSTVSYSLYVTAERFLSPRPLLTSRRRPSYPSLTWLSACHSPSP